MGGNFFWKVNFWTNILRGVKHVLKLLSIKIAGADPGFWKGGRGHGNGEVIWVFWG